MYIVSPGTRRCKGMISTIVIYHSLYAHVGDPFALTLLIWLACFGLGSFDDFLFGKKSERFDVVATDQSVPMRSGRRRCRALRIGELLSVANFLGSARNRGTLAISMLKILLATHPIITVPL